MRASFSNNSRSLKTEGAGNAGRSLRPQPCVRNKKAHKHSHHGHTGITRHSPRNGFTAYNALSPVTGLVCHRRLRKLPSANLTPASGRQDHTTSPSAATTLVLHRCHVHRIPHPTSVTIAQTPLLRGTGWRQCEMCRGCAARRAACDRSTRRAICAWRTCAICPTGEAEYFSQDDWTAFG
jgi:hypothetical protein